MKKVFIFLACISASFIVTAQFPVQKNRSILYENNFDDLPLGAYLAQSHPDWWTTWFENPGGEEDVIVTNEQSSSAPHSTKYFIDKDMVFKADNKTSGTYKINFEMYIPNNGAFFDILQIFDGMNSKRTLSVYFNAIPRIVHNGHSTDISFPYNTWFPISLFINLDKDIANIKINNIQYLEWQFSILEYGGTGTKQLAGINFYPLQAGTIFFIDNFVFESASNEITITPPFIYHEVAEGTTVPITKPITITNSGNGVGEYYSYTDYDFLPASGSGVYELRQCNNTPSGGVGSTSSMKVEFGVKFSKNDLCGKVGTYITKMSCYLNDVVVNNSLKFRVYAPLSNGSPGELLMECTKQDAVINQWNEVILPQSVLIDKNELWLSVECNIDGKYSMGLDSGPLKQGVNFTRVNGGKWEEYSFAGNFLLKAEATGAAIPCWLSFTGNTVGSVPGGSSASFNAVLNPAGLPYNVYMAHINIFTNDQNNPEIKIPTTLVVLPSQPAPIMWVSPKTISETTSVIGTITKQITVTNYGNAMGTYNAMLEGVTNGWISLAGNTNGSVPYGNNHVNFNAVINTGGLAYGTYTATLKVSTDDIKHPLFEIPCKLVYEPATPELSVSPTSIYETIAPGAVMTKQITVTNTGGANGEYTAKLEGGNGWISLSGATTGTVAGGSNKTFDAIINSEGLDYGTYTATIKITTNDPVHPLFEIPCTIILSKEGIEAITLDDLITVYPNPTNGMINVQCLMLNVQNIEIFDVMGRVVTVETWRAASLQQETLNIKPENTTPPFGHPTNNGGEFTLDISNAPSGIYFIRIQTENDVVTRKIVKQ